MSPHLPKRKVMGFACGSTHPTGWRRMIKGVDGRVKPGHDGERAVGRRRACSREGGRAQYVLRDRGFLVVVKERRFPLSRE